MRLLSSFFPPLSPSSSLPVARHSVTRSRARHFAQSDQQYESEFLARKRRKKNFQQHLSSAGICLSWTIVRKVIRPMLSESVGTIRHSEAASLRTSSDDDLLATRCSTDLSRTSKGLRKSDWIFTAVTSLPGNHLKVGDSLIQQDVVLNSGVVSSTVEDHNYYFAHDSLELSLRRHRSKQRSSSD